MLFFLLFFFFFKQKTAYEMLRSLVGSEMCIRDSTYLSLHRNQSPSYHFHFLPPPKNHLLYHPFFDHLSNHSGPPTPVSYTHLRAHETPEHLVCRLLLEKKKSLNRK